MFSSSGYSWFRLFSDLARGDSKTNGGDSLPNVILGHPYSGALYAYFSDELGGEWSHTRIARTNGYYRTLYGNNYRTYSELALTFLLLYDHVWITPADNHMPRSRVDPGNRSYIAELGLHADFDDYNRVPYLEQQRHIDRYFQDPRVRYLLLKVLRVPAQSVKLVLDSAVYEAWLSARTRVPLLCSRGRRALIERLVTIDRPSLHPVLANQKKVTFVQSYRELTGMALLPKSLDALMDAKSDQAVRAYGSEFLRIALREESSFSDVDAFRMAALVQEAIETESVANLFAGSLKWAARFFRLTTQTPLSVLASMGALAADKIGHRAGWYEFAGSVNRAIDKANLMQRLREIANVTKVR